MRLFCYAENATAVTMIAEAWTRITPGRPKIPLRSCLTLQENQYIAGNVYTIADMAIFPWYGGLAKSWQYGAAEFLSVQDYKNVQRWADMLLERPRAAWPHGQSPLGRAIEPVARAA